MYFLVYSSCYKILEVVYKQYIFISSSSRGCEFQDQCAHEYGVLGESVSHG